MLARALREGQTLRGVPAVAALEAFRVEHLRPARGFDSDSLRANGAKPYYELYGEKMVEAGRYRRVIRYREHVAPLEEALREHVLRVA